MQDQQQPFEPEPLHAPGEVAARWAKLRQMVETDITDYRDARGEFMRHGDPEDVARVQAKIDASRHILQYMTELDGAS